MSCIIGIVTSVFLDTPGDLQFFFRPPKKNIAVATIMDRPPCLVRDLPLKRSKIDGAITVNHSTKRKPEGCTHEIKEIVKLLPGYESPCDWKLLQTEIKKFYWKSDHPKNSCAALNTLIRESPLLPLNSYLLKFTTITDVLVANGVLTTVNRVDRLLERLDEKLRIKVKMFCTEKGWKVFDHDIGETPNFDEIKKFLEQFVLQLRLRKFLFSWTLLLLIPLLLLPRRLPLRFRLPLPGMSLVFPVVSGAILLFIPVAPNAVFSLTP
jgi:hypothetical protein